MIDCHVHTNYSVDGTVPPEDMVRAAVQKGVTYLAVTDHLDLSPDGTPSISMEKLRAYRAELSVLKEQYRGVIEIAAGIEVGYTQENERRIADMIGGISFDYIINSVHAIDGSDCFFPEYFAGKSKNQSYRAYFDAVLKSLDAPYPYHAVGHLGYVERKAPYPDPRGGYEDFADLLDAILQKIVVRKKILEINTNMYGGKVPWLPNDGVLFRYAQTGGTRIAFASDAHDVNRIGDRYREVCGYAKSLGFNGFTVIVDNAERKIEF